MQLILVRHGRTEWNARRLIQGHSEIPLDEVGVDQARALAVRLGTERRRPIGLILSSDLRRARQTAEILQRTIGAPLVCDPRLRETRFGSLEGLTYEQYDAVCGAANLREHPNVLEYDFRHFGGEHAAGVLWRFNDALRSVTLADDGHELLVVSHGRALRTLYYALNGVNRHFDNAAMFRTAYTPP